MVEDIITRLDMSPHPEGGFYKETYRSPQMVTTLDGRERSVCTAIYYLMCDDNISHLHRIKSDEIWLFHEGEAVELLIIEGDEARLLTLGNRVEHGEQPQIVVPATAWFGARVKGGKGHALVSCTVSPGFEFEDFELATEEEFKAHPCYEGIKEFIKLFF